MDDRQIVMLYWQRSEAAIRETSDKYGPYLECISYHILSSREDAQECVNDTYHSAWNAMPPHFPEILSTFLGKITRRISIDRWRHLSAQKRGGGQMPLVLSELEFCVSGQGSVEEEAERQELIALLHRFLRELPDQQRDLFLCRYWYLNSIAEIAHTYGFSESKVTSMLFRIRKKLRAQLQKEGY